MCSSPTTNQPMDARLVPNQVRPLCTALSCLVSLPFSSRPPQVLLTPSCPSQAIAGQITAYCKAHALPLPMAPVAPAASVAAP